MCIYHRTGDKPLPKYMINSLMHYSFTRGKCANPASARTEYIGEVSFLRRLPLSVVLRLHFPVCPLSYATLLKSV